MNESQKIIELFEDLYDGSPWIDVNIKDTLEELTPGQAAEKILQGRNSIWEIVNHLIHWRLNVLERMKGTRMTTPGNNYFTPVTDTSSDAWRNTLENLKHSQDAWTHYLSAMNGPDYLKVYAGNNMTHYRHIHGIIQHDAYHLGQIVLLSKLL